MLKLIITKEAENDLVEIAEYTETQWGIKQQDKYKKELEDRIFYLVENPTHGKKRDEIKSGYLSYSEGKHHIFYFFDEKIITIIGILHERMDFEKHL